MPTVSIVYPADPVGVVPGGIDTFIRGIAKHAPPDIRIRLIGVTTDPGLRPVGRWTTCAVGDGAFDMFPVLELHSAGARGRLPLSVRFSAAVAGHRRAVDGDILEFHRLEPALLFQRDRRPKNAFIHQNMRELRNRQSDILWSRLPWLYYRLEDRLLPGFASVFVVVEGAAGWYRERYPAQRERFRFTPTWVDTEDFRLPSTAERGDARRAVLQEFDWPADTALVISVGRLDSQKDPVLLARSFALLRRQCAAARLLYVGDGVLRGELELQLAALGLQDAVRVAGLRSVREIARLLWAADLFALASAYEGMPMSILEALGSGVPVVATDVGEVRRVVRPGQSGVLVTERAAPAIAAALATALGTRTQLTGHSCLAAVAPYTPPQVLAPVYENYRRIAAAARAA